MRIGIDIDGVITNIERFQLDYGTMFCIENNIGNLINPNAYDAMDIFGWNKKSDDLFWKKYFEFYVKNERPRPFASKIIKKIKEQGNEIYLITGRTNSGWDTNIASDIKTNTKKWLDNNEIVYDKLIFSPEDKRDNCKENEIELMIEDKPENIINISKMIPVICFDNKYNQECKGENIIRCYSWYDIYDKITNKLLKEGKR